MPCPSPGGQEAGHYQEQGQEGLQARAGGRKTVGRLHPERWIDNLDVLRLKNQCQGVLD